MQSAKSPGWILTPWGSRIVVIVLTVLAYLPALQGDFLGVDDQRFIVDNEAVHELSIGQARKFFFDPSTVAEHTWEGIYRPLRTLDFAIDWAVSGGTPFFFHLKNILYHVLASLLALALFRKLAGDVTEQTGKAALFGALLFSLHPVQVESVAWITSRGDVLLLVLFLAATLLHLNQKYWLAGAAFVAAILAKESAIVFPAVVLALDLIRREKVRWIPIACYGGISAVYCLAWFSLQPHAGHLDTWWGGSWPATVQMMLRGTVFYARAVLAPVRFVYDYHVPATAAIDAGTILGVALLAGAGVVFWKGGTRIRIAIAWFFLAIGPTSNILVTVGIPTAERFVYLPMVGLAFAAGHLLARWRWVYGLPVLLCLGALTFARCYEWQSDASLFRSAVAGEETPRGYLYLVGQSLARAESAGKESEAGDENRALAVESRREAAATVAYADAGLRLFDEQLRSPGSGLTRTLLWQKAGALLLLGRVEEAYDAARESAKNGAGGVRAYYYAGDAAGRLAADKVKTVRPGAEVSEEVRIRFEGAGLFAEAGEFLSSARGLGYPEPDLRDRIADCYRQAGNGFLYILDREKDPELMAEYHEAAALNFFKAANVLIDISNSLKGGEPDLLLNAIKFHSLAGENFEASAKKLEKLSPPEVLSTLKKQAGDSFHQVGMIQGELGGRHDAILSFLRSAENYEYARLDLQAAGVATPPEIDTAAAGSLFKAASLMEARGELQEAARFYKMSQQLADSPETRKALMRVVRGGK